MYFTSHELTLTAESVVGPEQEQVQFRDTAFVVQCWPGAAAPDPVKFEVTGVVRTDDQTVLSREWWEVSSVEQFGRFKAVQFKFKGAGFSDRIANDALPADRALYETFIRGGRITLVVELLEAPNDPTRTDHLVLTLDYGSANGSDNN